jgi:hypothetical protein
LPFPSFAQPVATLIDYILPMSLNLVNFVAHYKSDSQTLGDNVLTVELLRNGAAVATSVLNLANPTALVLGTFPFVSGDTLNVKVTLTSGSDPLVNFIVTAMAGTQ